jgi:AmiR/NasT family two-component response regulator
MSEQSVFVIWTNPLFHEAVRLILQHPGIRFVGSSSDTDEAKSLIAALNPEVVIIEETGDQDSVETMPILQAGHVVIRLGLADNELNIYRHQHQTAATADDLVHMIVDGAGD